MQKQTAEEAKRELRKYAVSKKGKLLSRFFKTGPGQYGEGDLFLGVMVPQTRAVAEKFRHLNLREVQLLLKSPFHEDRLLGLLILVDSFQAADTADQEKYVEFYLKNLKYVNNWDLVDLSAHHILGAWYFCRSRKPLYTLTKSKSLWERRISILSTFYFIRENDFKDALKIAELHLQDKEDLMHKAVGWMLREIGKRNLEAEEKFLKRHYKKMPRTMLRYAIERFPEKKRLAYLKGTAT